MSIYMKVPFASGSVTAKGYIDWIELDSLQLDSDRNLSTEWATGKQKNLGKTRFSPFNITKRVDESSPSLISEAWTMHGAHTIEIAVVEPGDTPKEFVKFTLSNAVISSYSVSSAGDRPFENFSLTFDSIEMKFTPHDAANRGGTANRVSYDLVSK